MKVNPEVLKKLAENYAKSVKVKREFFHSSKMIAFDALNDLTNPIDHDSEDIDILAGLLLGMGIGSKKELDKKKWDEYMKREKERQSSLVVVSSSQPQKKEKRYWFQDI